MSEHNPNLTKTNKILYPKDIIVTNCWSGDREKYSFSYYLDAFEFTAKILNSGISAKLYIPESEEKILQLQQLFKEKYQEPIATKVKENTVIPFSHSLNNITPGKQIVKPTILQGETVILVDGCLPSKGSITCKKLILILDSNNFWWTKNFNLVHASTIEIWSNSNIHPQSNITKLVHSINTILPTTEVIVKTNYVRDINIALYNKVDYTPDPNNKKYLLYVHGDNRELFNIQNNYKVDIFKEIKLALLENNNNEEITKKTLMVVGWAPNYDLASKMHYSRHKDERVWENRRRAINLSDDLEEYLNTINPEDKVTMANLGYKMDSSGQFQNLPLIEVEVYPECDLPIPNFSEFDNYIFLPPVNLILPNTDRILLECYMNNKRVITPEVTKRYFNTNATPNTKSYVPITIPKPV